MAASTISDFSGAMTLVAPVGGTTAGVVVCVSTVSKLMAFPYQTVASGANFQGYIGDQKIIGAANKTSGTAWVIGQPLVWSTANTQFLTVVTGSLFIVARAASAAASADVVGDVILCFPTGPTPA